MAQTGTAPAAKKTATTKPGAASTVKKAAAPAAGAPKAAAPKTAAPKVVAPAKPAGLYATIAVSHGAAPLGRIVFKFYEKESPVTVKNFTDLALGLKEWTHPETGERSKKPLFNGLTFHRVIPGFMIQGGDPTGTGMGRTVPIPDEFHPELKFDIPGRVAMANAGPGTGSCQFFITEGPTPHLTGRHTIFGQVVEGQALVEQIARLPRGGNDKPETPVVMTRVTVQRIGPGPAVGGAVTKKAVTSKKGAAPATKKAVTPTTKKSAAPATTKKTAAPATK
ncbi:MAG: peptidylprolyl isomerase [Acidobacteria bacterium]|nr:peptidylprolyl isomerase [Acidobacteriota bacterium]